MSKKTQTLSEQLIEMEASMARLTEYEKLLNKACIIAFGSNSKTIRTALAFYENHMKKGAESTNIEA